MVPKVLSHSDPHLGDQGSAIWGQLEILGGDIRVSGRLLAPGSRKGQETQEPLINLETNR